MNKYTIIFIYAQAVYITAIIIWGGYHNGQNETEAVWLKNFARPDIKLFD